MKKNFNKSGRFIRIVLGSALVLAYFTGMTQDRVLDNLMLGIGAFLLLTVLINFCPLFYFLGINTARSKGKVKKY